MVPRGTITTADASQVTGGLRSGSGQILRAVAGVKAHDIHLTRSKSFPQVLDQNQ